MPDDKSKKSLQFCRLVDPKVFRLIPRELFEQIEELAPGAVDRLIDCGARTLNIIKTDDGFLVFVPNPLVHIAVLHDDQNKMHGFLWAEFDLVEEIIFVQAASVRQQYQGDFRKRMVEYLFGLNGDNIPQGWAPETKIIRMATMRPKPYERSGWKRSERTLMEICDEDMGSEDTGKGQQA